MMEFIVPFIVGVILIVLGISNMRGNVSSLHSYHRHRVSEEDRIPFGKQVGLGTVIIGVGIIIFSILSAITLYTENNIFVLIGTAVLIVISIVMANVLSARYGFSLITAFLAMAPGGIAEMSLAGMSMRENVSVILTYQLVRILAINLGIPPLLKWMFPKKGLQSSVQ